MSWRRNGNWEKARRDRGIAAQQHHSEMHATHDAFVFRPGGTFGVVKERSAEDQRLVDEFMAKRGAL